MDLNRRAKARGSVLAVVLGLGCSGAETVDPPPVASIEISPGPAISLLSGRATHLTATLKDAQGNALSGRLVSWNSSAPSVATVSLGLVTAVTAGVAQIRATSEGKTGEVIVTVSANPWRVTGSLTTGRTAHTATLLANGKVLVAGGHNVPGPPFQTLTSCELYDPTAGTWSSTGSMSAAREAHIAIRLLDGRVLVVGGFSLAGGRLNSAELYDPIAGTWSPTGSLTTARLSTAAVLLPNGKVLVSGGSGTGTDIDALDSAELYDPGTGTWGLTGSMTETRSGHTATLLGNGRVLAAGGIAGTSANPLLRSSAELYDPTLGTWSVTGGFATARAYQQAVLLASGKVLLAGGETQCCVTAASDLYDPGSGAWASTGALSKPREFYGLALLGNGVLAIGGFGNGGPGEILLSVERYDPLPGTWSPSADLLVARASFASVVLLNGKVLVVGGQGAGAGTAAEVFDPAVLFP